jgi:hypothetical protein
MRANESPATRKLDELYEEGELGQVIKHLSGRADERSTELQRLPCPSIGQVTDYYAFLAIVSEYYHEWQALPKTLDPAADLLARHPVWWQSLLHYEDTGEPQRLHPDSDIPLPLKDGLPFSRYVPLKSARKFKLTYTPLSRRESPLKTSSLLSTDLPMGEHLARLV